MDAFAGGLADPFRMGLAALGAGFVAAAAVKLFGFLFMRWKTPYRLGAEMASVRAEVVEWNGDKKGGEGYVRAGGEMWRATSTDNLQVGDAVSVARVDGLRLKVKRK